MIKLLTLSHILYLFQQRLHQPRVQGLQVGGGQGQGGALPEDGHPLAHERRHRLHHGLVQAAPSHVRCLTINTLNNLRA